MTLDTGVTIPLDQDKETEGSLSVLIDQLTGSEFDLQGLSEFKKLLGGEE